MKRFPEIMIAAAIVLGGASYWLAHTQTRNASIQEQGEARTYYAQCGAYDVLVIGHDQASGDDARRAALAYVQDGCEYGRGLPPVGER